MKCTKCQAVIDQGVKVCPYCGTNLEPNNANVLPNTPASPVLPEDQSMKVEEVKKADAIENTTMQNNDIKEPVTSNLATNTGVINIPTETPNTSLETPDAPNNATVNNVAPTSSTPNVDTPVNVATPNVDIDTSSLTNNTLSPDGNITTPEPLPTPGGEKIGNVETPKEDKKKKSKKLLIIIIIVLVLVGAGGFIYYYEFQTSNKRVLAVVNNMLSSIKNSSNEAISKKSGTYDISASIKSGQDTTSVSFDGSYQYDLAKDLLDLKLNIKDITAAGTKYIPSPLNLEMYMKDTKAYLLVSNFYDKYISFDVSKISSTVTTQSNDEEVNYQLLIINLKNVIKSTVNTASKTQSVKKVNINGKESLSNVVRISLNEGNVTRMYQTFINQVSSNETLLKELAKLTGYTEEELKTKLASTKFEYSLSPTDYIEVYTDLIGSKFKGLKLSVTTQGKTQSYLLIPNNGSYTIDISENNSKVGSVSYNKNSSKDNTTSTNEYKFKVSFKVGNDNYEVELNIKLGEDNTPNVSEVNVKESVNYANIPVTDWQTIQSKMNSYGTLGSMLTGILSMVMPSSTSTPYSSTPYSQTSTPTVTTPETTTTTTTTYYMNDPTASTPVVTP